QVLVEPDDVPIRPLDLQVDLRAAELRQAQLRLPYQRAPDAASLVLGSDGDAVQPAAVAVVAGQGRADDGTLQGCNEEQIALAGAPAGEDRFRCAPARVVVEDAPPECGHRVGVVGMELTDLHHVRHGQWSCSATASAAASPLRTQSAMPTPRYAAPASASPGSPATRRSIAATRSR